MWKLYTQRKVVRYTEYSEYLEYFASLYVRGVPGSDTSSIEYTYSIATCTSIGSISIATGLSLLGPTVISMDPVSVFWTDIVALVVVIQFDGEFARRMLFHW